jgi:hypothetical protein
MWGKPFLKLTRIECVFGLVRHGHLAFPMRHRCLFNMLLLLVGALADRVAVALVVIVLP